MWITSICQKGADVGRYWVQVISLRNLEITENLIQMKIYTIFSPLCDALQKHLLSHSHLILLPYRNQVNVYRAIQ